MPQKNLRKLEQNIYRLSRVYTLLQNEPITIEIDDDEPEVRNKTIPVTSPPPPQLQSVANKPNAPAAAATTPRTNGVPTILRNGALRSQQQLLQQHHQQMTTTPQRKVTPPAAAAAAHNVVSSTSTPTPRRPHLLTDADLIGLIQDLQLQKDKAALLINRFRQWNLLDSSCLLDTTIAANGTQGPVRGTEFKRRSIKDTGAVVGSPAMLVHSTSNSVKRKHQELC